MPRYIEELVAQQMRRSELARQREAEQGLPCERPVLTISRTMGSGARIVAQKLAQELGWSLWARELIDEVADDAHVSKRIVEAFDERVVSQIDALTRSLLGDFEMGGFMYVRHLVRTVNAIGKLGNAIILGRGANIILPQALNVRIDASFEKRVANMVKFEDMTPEAASEKVRRSDRERDEFLVSAFGQEKVEQAHPDIAIWMDEFEIDDAVQVIKTALMAWCKRRQ